MRLTLAGAVAVLAFVVLAVIFAYVIRGALRNKPQPEFQTKEPTPF